MSWHTERVGAERAALNLATGGDAFATDAREAGIVFVHP